MGVQECIGTSRVQIEQFGGMWLGDLYAVRKPGGSSAEAALAVTEGIWRCKQEACEAEARGMRGEDEADQPEDFISARLGRAFVDGYGCTDEEELRRVCGVVLR